MGAWSPSEREKGAYWEALYACVCFAQEQRCSILAWPVSEQGWTTLGSYYTSAADLLCPVLWQASRDGDALNVLLTFAIITSAHLQEIARDPGSTVSLHTLAMRQYAQKTLTDELWGEMERIIEAWRRGSFQPANYPATLAQTVA